MAHTPHGWHIAGTLKDEKPIAVKRCGGPLACLRCLRYAAQFLNHPSNTNVKEKK